MVIARIESFILGKTLKDAINRAEAYSKAGADAIMIHSKRAIQEKFSLSLTNLKIQNILSQWYQYPQHILLLLKNN